MVFPLVSTEWLSVHLMDPEVRVADVRWYLLDRTRTGLAEYQDGHIPGAVFVDLDGNLASPVGEGPGRHPLPRPEVFEQAMIRAGVDPETLVVAYDDSGGSSAARLWWLLRYFGHERAVLLDGGINQWIKEGRPLETRTPEVRAGKFRVTDKPHREWLVDQEMVAQIASEPNGLVIDSRLGERYRGEVEPLDPRAGHVPGAKNAPLAGNLRGPDDFRFLSARELRERFDWLGASQADRIAAYCGSGINACQNIVAL
ncbi:MAG: sulfurtransferase, partial [Rudaea sp.]